MPFYGTQARRLASPECAKQGGATVIQEARTQSSGWKKTDEVQDG